MARPNPIIYQNADADITLIDIPTSIVAAQGDRSDILLLSTAPLEAPLQPKEDYRPRTQKTKEAKAAQTQDVDSVQQKAYSLPIHASKQVKEPASRHNFQSRNLDEERYKVLVQDALAQIRTQVSGPWCTRRKLMTQRPLSGEEGTMDVDSPTEKDVEARMREWAALNQTKEDDTAFSLQQLMASLSAASEAAEPATDTNQWTLSYRPAREAESGSTQAADTDMQDTPTEPWTGTFYNAHHYSLQATIAEQVSQSAPSGQAYRFTIPPRASLFLSDTTASDAFRTSFRQLTDEYSLLRHFDLVLLDPPWPNRSAKRKGAYEQVGGVPYLTRMLLNMDIDTYLEHNALVGVWITNKASLRDHVLGPGGLFETWNVGLMEEWIWVKTTTKGEPMFDIDDAMRKPYELLLLGRAAPNAWTTMVHAPLVKRRVIAAVPDVHSRKPCLKTLLEPFLVDPTDYSALEVYSRYLVSGWTSWGNEVLKYNWDGYWAPAESAET